jgi:hypothetical protein
MRVRLSAALLLASVVLAGCGSSTPTGASPAPLAPANSLVYAELTVRPAGTQRATVESALTRLLGHSPDADIQRLTERIFGSAGLNYGSNVAPWLGQKIGLVVTHFSRDGLGLIAPTTNPAGALKTFRRVVHAKLTSASYAGIHYQQCVDPVRRLALGTVGHNAVIAAPAVFKEIVDAYHGRSLTKTAAFGSAFSTVPGTPLIRAYVNSTGVGSALPALLGSLPTGRLPSGIQQLYGAALAKLHGTLGFSLTAAPHALTVDFHSSVVHGGQGADVGGLSGQSWFALASGQLNLKPAKRMLSAAMAQNPAMQLALSQVRSKLGLDLVHDILPALGPLQLSFQGSAALTAAGALVIRPADPAAADRVVAAIRRLAAHSASLAVEGSAQNFTITRRGLPIPRIAITETAGKLVVTFDETPAQALTPATHLSASPRLATARSGLPGGSQVPLFIDFRGLAQLLQGLPNFNSNPRDQQILGVLQRLDYLVLGANKPEGDVRLVLGLS